VGQGAFNQIGCATCHVATIVTAPAGTVVTTQDAIARHGGQAASVVAAYNALPDARVKISCCDSWFRSESNPRQPSR
jgi:hypothetical protein